MLPGFLPAIHLAQVGDTIGRFSARVLILDVNGDTIQDLVACDADRSVLSVFLGVGGGEFEAEQTFSIPDGNPWGMTSADLDSDGDIDVAVTNFVMNSVTVLLNTADEGFDLYTALPAIDTEHRTTGVVARCLDGDSIPDLLVAYHDAGQVQFFRGTGDGGFVPGDSYDAGLEPAGIATGHFNGNDGALDFIVCHEEDPFVDVYTNDGDGIFTLAQTLEVGMGSILPVVSDIDSDGYEDIVIGHLLGSHVSVLYGWGDAEANFTVTAFEAGPSPVAVDVGDFNQDGHQGLVCGSYLGTTVGLLAWDGARSFAAPVFDMPGTFGPNGLAIGDLNQDGEPDVVFAGGGDSLTVYFNDPSMPPPPPNNDPIADAGLTSSHVIAAIGESSAVVALNGTASTDEDGDTLAYSWAIDGAFAGIGPILEADLLVNLQHTVTLTVTDGRGGVDSDTILVTVESPAAAATSLIDVVATIEFSNDTSTSTFLTSSLAAASSSFASGNVGAGINKLQAFQNKLLAKAGKSLSDAEAQELINLAQEIIDSSQP